MAFVFFSGSYIHNNYIVINLVQRLYENFEFFIKLKKKSRKQINKKKNQYYKVFSIFHVFFLFVMLSLNNLVNLSML